MDRDFNFNCYNFSGMEWFHLVTKMMFSDAYFIYASLIYFLFKIFKAGGCVYVLANYALIDSDNDLLPLSVQENVKCGVHFVSVLLC